MIRTFRELLRDDRGATMVEYAFMVTLIAVVCIVVIGTFGKTVSNAFSTVNASI